MGAKWIKLNTDIFDNRKVRFLRSQPEGDSLALAWVMLLALAGKCNAGGEDLGQKGAACFSASGGELRLCAGAAGRAL